MISYTATLNTAATVITLAEAKAHLRLTHAYEDDVVQSYIDAAVIAAENYTGRYLNTYDVVVKTGTFATTFPLNYAPVIDDAVVITYFDSDNAEQTLATTEYDLMYRNGEPEIFFKPDFTAPNLYNRNDAVKLTYSSGFATNIPTPFKQYVKLVVAFLYENRGDTVDKLPRFTNTILRPYKRWQ